jgi:hypothetical protein
MAHRLAFVAGKTSRQQAWILSRQRVLSQVPTTTRRSLHATNTLSQPVIPFKLADIGEGIAEVEVLQWFIKDGDDIKQFQNVCEVQSDKVSLFLFLLFFFVLNPKGFTKLFLFFFNFLKTRRQSKSHLVMMGSSKKFIIKWGKWQKLDPL